MVPQENDFLVTEIINMEWEMFHSVNNIGGRAECQDQAETFEIMRRSNLATWPEELLYSYRADLYAAVEAGRNLMTEKYARMMENTDPKGYEEIRQYLPSVDESSMQLVVRATEILMQWEREVRGRYPLATRGRDLDYDNVDSGGKTSFETYLQAELETYSHSTLSLYVGYLEELDSAHVNGSQLVYENMVTLYGYHDLDEANAQMSRGL